MYTQIKNEVKMMHMYDAEIKNMGQLVGYSHMIDPMSAQIRQIDISGAFDTSKGSVNKYLYEFLPEGSLDQTLYSSDRFSFRSVRRLLIITSIKINCIDQFKKYCANL